MLQLTDEELHELEALSRERGDNWYTGNSHEEGEVFAYRDKHTEALGSFDCHSDAEFVVMVIRRLPSLLAELKELRGGAKK